MERPAELWRRLLFIFRRRQFDRDLEEEMRFHLEMKAQQNRDAGMNADEARFAARRKFGNVTLLREVSRDMWGSRALESLLQDLRYAVRVLRHSPGFTLVAILSLALGIGANVTVFSLFNAVMLRMLPVSKPEQLVAISHIRKWGREGTSYPLYLALRERKDLFEGVLARTGALSVPVGANRAELAYREFVSGEYFPLLGIQPALGRLITPEDTRVIGGQPFAVLSYEFWRSRFGGDPSIVGRVIRVDSQPVTVIGVAQPGFRGVATEVRTQLWEPLTMYGGKLGLMDPDTYAVSLLARPAEGITHRQLQSALDVFLQHRLAAQYGNKPDTQRRRDAMSQRLELQPGGIGISMMREQFGEPLEILLAAVTMVLLIACANVAGLMLARGAARRREIALRFSIGASRARVLRQLLTESLLLAAAGGGAGLLLAAWGRQGLLHFFLFQPDVSLDRAVLSFAGAVSLASAVVFGILPAFRATAIDSAPSLKEGGAGARNRRRPTLRRCFVVAQVALSVVLVMTAGLFARSLARLRAVNPGFRDLTVSTFAIGFPGAYKDTDAASFRRRYLARVGSLPGVLSTSFGFPGPYQGGGWSGGIRIPGSEVTAREAAVVEMQSIAPRYFATLGGTLLRGREFDARDSADTAKVAVVNEAFARAYFNGADPMGRAFSRDDEKPEGGERTTIVGLVRDMRHKDVRAKALPTIYVPSLQVGEFFPPNLLVRATLAPESLVPLLRRELAAMDPSLALVEFGSIRQQIDNSIYIDRLLAVVSGFFGVISLLLAGIGLYGVMAYTVAGRTSEIGVRVALGASRRRVLWMMLKEGLTLTAAGVLLGAPLSLALARVAGSLLFGIRAQDPPTLVSTVIVLLATGAIAVLLPARRATRIDPIEALRYE